MKIFIPRMYQKDIFRINYQKLKEKGYKLIIFDLDNTIGTIDTEECDLKTVKFINDLTKDFKIVIASNSYSSRVFKYTKEIKCDVFAFSLKPTLKVIRKIKKKYQINYQDMVIIGDQILTDVLVGNRKGLLTILVDPIKNLDFKVTSLNRRLERVINKKNKLIKGAYYEEK